MAKPLKARGRWGALQSLGGDVCQFPVSFSTDGSGVATLDKDYGGLLTITKNTNDYLLTLPGSWAETLSIVPWTNHATVYFDNIVDSPAAGTVDLQCSASLVSAKVRVIITVSVTNKGRVA